MILVRLALRDIIKIMKVKCVISVIIIVLPVMGRIWLNALNANLLMVIKHLFCKLKKDMITIIALFVIYHAKPVVE